MLLGHSHKNNFLSAIQLNAQLANVNNTISVCLCLGKKQKESLMVQAGNAEALLQLLTLTVMAEDKVKIHILYALHREYRYYWVWNIAEKVAEISEGTYLVSVNQQHGFVSFIKISQLSEISRWFNVLRRFFGNTHYYSGLVLTA